MSVLQHSKQRGFTIVELLIVIVVIAILAAITVVAYNGISERARNTSRLNTVRQMQQVVQLALTRHSPKELWDAMEADPSGWHKACLGEGYADLTGDTVGDCAKYGATKVSVVPAFNQLMSDLTDLPDMSSYPSLTDTSGQIVSGPFLGSAWVDASDKLVIEYRLEGEGQDCEFSPLVYKLSGSNSMTPSGDPKYTASSNGITECSVVMVAEPHFYD